MTTREKKTRFCFNNYIETGFYTASSSHASYPSTNLVGGLRSNVWQANGLFTITASNNKVYINGTTYAIGSGSYTSSTLITALNTATGQTFTRNSNGRFVITLGVSGTLNLATTTDAMWSTLGFLSTSNLTGTVFTADERKYNNGEWLKVDVSQPQECNFACLIPPNETAFSAPTATIKLQGNNVDLWDSPPVDLTMEVSSVGAFVAPAIDTQACRYWRIYIDDTKNNAISAAVAYIGSAFTPQNTNLATGLMRNRRDQSVRLYSEGGQLYVNRKPRLLTLSSTGLQLMTADDLVEMEQLAFDLGVGRPFFIVVDPDEEVSNSLSEMTHYVEVDSDIDFTHVLRNYYNVNFSLREVI